MVRLDNCAARWAKLKGAKRVIGIDKVPSRLMFAAKDGIEVIDFSKFSDIPKRIYELVPEGLDVAINAGKNRVLKALMDQLLKARRYFP